MGDPFPVIDLFHYLARLCEAQERIAAADEQRNILLIEDAAERKRAWQVAQRNDEERWAGFIREPGP